MSNGKVTFKIDKKGKASYEMSGYPGQSCLDAKEDVAPILQSIGATELETEATDEMHMHAGKAPEAHNNV